MYERDLWILDDNMLRERSAGQNRCLKADEKNDE